MLVGSLTLLVSLYLPWANITATGLPCATRITLSDILKPLQRVRRQELRLGGCTPSDGAAGLLAVGSDGRVRRRSSRAGRLLSSYPRCRPLSLALVLNSHGDERGDYLEPGQVHRLVTGISPSTSAYGAYWSDPWAPWSVFVSAPVGCAVAGTPSGVSASAVAGAGLAVGLLLACFLIQQLTFMSLPRPTERRLPFGLCALAFEGDVLIAGPSACPRALRSPVAAACGLRERAPRRSRGDRGARSRIPRCRSGAHYASWPW